MVAGLVTCGGWHFLVWLRTVRLWGDAVKFEALSKSMLFCQKPVVSNSVIGKFKTVEDVQCFYHGMIEVFNHYARDRNVLWIFWICFVEVLLIRSFLPSKGAWTENAP